MYEHEALAGTEAAEVKPVEEADVYEHEALAETEAAVVKPVEEADVYEHEALAGTEAAVVKPVEEADEYEHDGFIEPLDAESSIVAAPGRDVSAKESVEAVDDTIKKLLAEAALEAQELQDGIEQEVSITAQAIIEEESTGVADADADVKLEGSAAEAGDHFENEEEDHYADEIFAPDGDVATSTAEPVAAALSVKAVATTNSVKASSKSAQQVSIKAATSSSTSPRSTPSHKTGTTATSGSTKRVAASPRANTHLNNSTSSKSVSSAGGKAAAPAGVSSSNKTSPRPLPTSASTKSTSNSSVH